MQCVWRAFIIAHQLGATRVNCSLRLVKFVGDNYCTCMQVARAEAKTCTHIPAGLQQIFVYQLGYIFWGAVGILWPLSLIVHQKGYMTHFWLEILQLLGQIIIVH